MATSAKETSGRTQTRRKRRRRKPVEPFELYVIAIDGWDWSFDFGINRREHEAAPYSDYRHLHIQGRLIAPSKVKADTVEVTLIPIHGADAVVPARDKPLGVGEIHLYRGSFAAYVGLPRDALSEILPMLDAERFRFVELQGDRLRYGKARITNYRLEMKIDDEDSQELCQTP